MHVDTIIQPRIVYCIIRVDARFPVGRIIAKEIIVVYLLWLFALHFRSVSAHKSYFVCVEFQDGFLIVLAVMIIVLFIAIVGISKYIAEAIFFEAHVATLYGSFVVEPSTPLSLIFYKLYRRLRKGLACK